MFHNTIKYINFAYLYSKYFNCSDFFPNKLQFTQKSFECENSDHNI